MPHKGASTQHHNQQVLAKPHHQPSDRDQQAREKLKQKAKIKSRAYIQLGEEALQIVHKTFAPDIPVILHLPALLDNTIDTNTPPMLYVIQEGINCMPTTDYFFTSIKPAPIVVTHPAANNNKPTEQQLTTLNPVSQQTHPLQPGETRVYPSMLTNKQVPVLNLTETSITSQADLQDTFQSLCLCSHDGKKVQKTKAQSDYLSDSKSSEDEVNPYLCTSEEERIYGTIKGSAQATQVALSHTRAQSNPMVERGPPKQAKIKKLSKEQAADKHTQTKEKEKPL